MTLTVTDEEGAPAACTAIVTVIDSIPPEMICPSDVSIECDRSTGPANTDAATATDNCSQDLVVSYYDLITPGICSEETIIRTWSTADASENMSSCTQTIEVVDTTAPVISCNATDITPPDAPISFTATAADNCDGEPIVQILEYGCTFYTKNGKEVNKDESCIVSFANDTITIDDSKGIDDIISWTVRATDCNGNIAEQVCSINVVKK